MKVIICDVGNAASAFVTDNNGNTMMIDCGSKVGKANPVDVFINQKEWLGQKDYVTASGESYPLALLHITHPDDDHVRNAKDVKKRIPPYLLQRTRYENFPDGDEVNSDYVRELDKEYRGSNPETIAWSFDINEIRSLSVETCMNNVSLCGKVRNNSSIVRYIKEDGVGILFCGDLEKAGWEKLLIDNYIFAKTLKEGGVNILFAPHHGHKSGFPKALFDLIGNVDIVIFSKDTEANIDGTDVSTQYSGFAYGMKYEALSNNSYYDGKVLTTRSNGNIYIATSEGGNYRIFTDKASSNHERHNYNGLWKG